jgi:HlyD family secretion protein
VVFGIILVVLLAGGVGGWAATSEIKGAVIAQGSIVVDSNVKKVQHPSGGVVGKLYVRDGDRVKAGDVVVRLDDTVTRANLAIVTKGLNELLARKARLAAERDGASKIAFPPELTGQANDPDAAEAMASEDKLFNLRRASRDGQKDQLRQQVAQLGQEIQGLSAQQSSKTREIDLVRRELDGVRDLYQKNLVQLTRLTSLEREAARLEGERGALVSSMAQTKGKIAETELKVLQVDQDMSSDVGKELREVDAKIGEFVERKITAEDQLKRIEIRAPQDGTVFQSAVHTVGGVIAAGTPSC